MVKFNIDMSQKQLIVKYLRSVWEAYDIKEYCWIKAYQLRGKQTQYGFLGHQADRRARELANEGLLERRIKDGYAEYRFIPPKVYNEKHHATYQFIQPEPLSRKQEELRILQQAIR